MMETDDKLLKQFLSEQKQEIADRGFSRKVMRNLPDRTNRIAQWWTIAFSLIAAVLYVVFGGLKATLDTLHEVFASMVQQGETNFDPKTLLIVAIVLVVIGANKIYSTDW